MTRYILAGGCDRKYPEYLTQLARVIQIDFEHPRILSCWFSNPDNEVETKFSNYKEHFLKFFGESTIVTKATKDEFVEQVVNADVIYLHGGSTTLLLAAMEEYGSMHEIFQGKIVVGSSAGANYISKVGFSPSIVTTGKGAGLASVSTIVHFGSRGFNDMTFDSQFWQDAIKNVRELSGSDDVILLPEGTFTVVDV